MVQNIFVLTHKILRSTFHASKPPRGKLVCRKSKHQLHQSIHLRREESDMEQLPKIGDRITDKLVPPDESTIRDWIGPKAFEHWSELRSWIETSYPGVFAPDWLYGGKKRGWSLRHKKTRAFCTLIPAYRLFSVLVVLGRVEREKFEERRYVWSPQLVKFYDEARTYPDGKWLTVTISSADDLHDVMELVSMKRPPLSLS
jgi:hypothetical protein